MGRPNLGWLLAAAILIVIPLAVFWYLITAKVDCDQFSCIGYLVLFGPMLLFGVCFIVIVLIVNIVLVVDKLIKKNSNERDS